MDIRRLHEPQGRRKLGRAIAVADTREAAPRERARKPIFSAGALYAHALAIECEAHACYREFATRMEDYGNDATAELFQRLAEFEAEHVFQLVKRSAGIELPTIDPAEHAWLDSGAPTPEARAFVFRMMTPQLALQIALRAEEESKAFFEKVRTASHDASVRTLAAEFVREEQSHIDWVNDALAHLPRPFQPSEAQPGDPTIEQRR